MISYDFEYHRPKTYQEAIELFKAKTLEGKKPIYYSGGTEVVTFARKNTVKTGAVIDIKAIEETNVFLEDDNFMIYGSSLSLNDIAEKTEFELMKNTVNKIADHTVRNRITIGGNICGRLFYREAVLSIMVSDGILVIAGEEGIRHETIAEGYDKRILLKPGEILLQIKIEKDSILKPQKSIRKVKYGDVDYPLFHIAALKDNGRVKYSFAGICAFPFRSIEMEEVLNDPSIEIKDRASQIIELMPSNIIDDIYASREFRQYLFENSLVEIMEEMEGVI